MGQKISDGKAINVTYPTAQVINDYDLYRVAGWNAVAIGAKDAVQTDRTMAAECDPSAIYSIKVPAGVNPVPGDKLYWAVKDSTTFQRGDTNLQAAVSATDTTGACVVLVGKNAAGYAQVRVLNP